MKNRKKCNRWVEETSGRRNRYFALLNILVKTCLVTTNFASSRPPEIQTAEDREAPVSTEWVIRSDSVEAVGSLGLVVGNVDDDSAESDAGGGTVSERRGKGGLLLAGSLLGGEFGNVASLFIAAFLLAFLIDPALI